jgi:hypothetical protein
VLGFFDEAWPQPFENSQRMWSFDQTVTIAKPLVTFPWRSISFYALTGKSVITFKNRLVKETIVEALEEICEQNPAPRILLMADNYALITRNSSKNGPMNSASSLSSFHRTR